MTRKRNIDAGKRAWSKLETPQAWLADGVRVAWHFIMSYHESEPGTVRGAPWQTGAGDWLVRVELDAGRFVSAAIESLDRITDGDTPR